MLVSWRKKTIEWQVHRNIALKKYLLSKCPIFWRGYNYVHFSLSSSCSLSFVYKWWRKLVQYNTIHYPIVELSNTKLSNSWTIQITNCPSMFLSTFQLLSASDGRSSSNTSPTYASPLQSIIKQYNMISQKYIMSSAYSLSRYPTTSIFW